MARLVEPPSGKMHHLTKRQIIELPSSQVHHLGRGLLSLKSASASNSSEHCMAAHIRMGRLDEPPG